MNGVLRAQDRRLTGLDAVNQMRDTEQVIGTGGFARMFEEESLFDEIVPELVLFGLKHAEQLNREDAGTR